MLEHKRLSAQAVLSRPVSFPNADAEARLSRLVGLDEHIETLTRDLRLIFDPQLVLKWSESNYGGLLPVATLVYEAVPLIVFEGDVGTGKTALAETIAQQVALDGKYGVHLVKMSTRVRGTGYVGEMGTLLADSFDFVEGLWEKKGEPILFLIDEADSLLTSRESEQHHHEDKSGVNTILQHLDAIRVSSAQVAVIAITNRVGVLDPAVRRRATSVLTFNRPNRSQRKVLLSQLFKGALSDTEIEVLVNASKERKSHDGTEIPLNYSDLTLRFAVSAIRNAVWSDEKLDAHSLAISLEAMEPTPIMDVEKTSFLKC